jgi:hypothetical protein
LLKQVPQLKFILSQFYVPSCELWFSWMVFSSGKSFPPSQFTMTVGNPFLTDTQFQSTCLHMGISSLCLCILYSSYKDIRHIGLEQSLIQSEFFLNRWHLQWPFFQIRSHSEILTGWIWILKDHYNYGRLDKLKETKMKNILYFLVCFILFWRSRHTVYHLTQAFI